ncbi:unnamed protein product, partial [Heterotrigona itama]
RKRNIDNIFKNLAQELLIIITYFLSLSRRTDCVLDKYEIA